MTEVGKPHNNTESTLQAPAGTATESASEDSMVTAQSDTTMNTEDTQHTTQQLNSSQSPENLLTNGQSTGCADSPTNDDLLTQSQPGNISDLWSQCLVL